MSATALLDLVGNTPLVRLSRIDTGRCELYAKLESQNPGGSIKDRIAQTMIEAAERDGHLRPGGTIVEATAGNTGIALALVGSLKGYRTLLVVPDKMSREKIQHLKALGAEVVMTRSDVGRGHPDYYQLYKRGAVTMDDALAYADSPNDLRLKIALEAPREDEGGLRLV